MAWLHSAPKKHDKDSNPKPRFHSLPVGHQARALPEINDYMSLCFELSGYCLNGSMGAIPLTWSEVDSFCNRSGYSLQGWETEQLIQMSRDYCYMLSKGAKIGCPPPYQEGISDEDALQQMRDRVAKQWESFGDNLKAK